MKKRFLIAATVLVFAVLFSVCVFAETAKIVMTDPTVALGDNVTVTATVSGSVGVAGYDIVATYDTSKITLSSSTGDGNFSCTDNAGTLTIHSDLSSGSGKMKFSLVFKTVVAGTTKINVLKGEMFDNDGEKMDTKSLGYSEIKITPPATASSDASLKGLSVSPGSLTPAFSTDNSEYSLTVGKDVSFITVSAEKNDSKASVAVSGNDNLTVGENKVVVTVTAEDGTVKKYNITVTKSAISLPTGEESKAKIKINGETEVFCMESVDASLIPEGFEICNVEIGGITVEGIKPSYSEKKAVFVQSTANEIEGFFFVDTETGYATAFDILTRGSLSIVLIDVAEITTPDGYNLTTLKIDGKDLNVLKSKNSSSENYCLLCGITPAGRVRLYVYDIDEDTLQRYGLYETNQTETVSENKTETSNINNNIVTEKVDTNTVKSNDDTYLIALKILIPVIVIAVIAMIVVSVIQNRKDDEFETPKQKETVYGISDEDLEAVEQNKDITDSFEDDDDISYVEDPEFKVESEEGSDKEDNSEETLNI